MFDYRSSSMLTSLSSYRKYDLVALYIDGNKSRERERDIHKMTTRK